MNYTEKVIKKQRSYLARFARMGAPFIKLKARSKAPQDKWKEAKPLSVKGINSHLERGGNLGIRLGALADGSGYLYAIDVDIWDPELRDDAIAELVQITGPLHCFPTVATGRKGGASRHIYFKSSIQLPSQCIVKSQERIDVNIDGRTTSKYSYQIDVLADNHYTVAPLSIHPNSGDQYLWETPPNFENEIPLMDLSVDRRDKNTEPKEPLGLDIEDARKALELAVKNDFHNMVDDFDGWLAMGMMLKHEFDGSKEAFELWCEFARQSERWKNEKFDVRGHRKKWDSFDNTKPNAVTMATVREYIRDVENMKIFEAMGNEGDEECLANGPLTFKSPEQCATSDFKKYLWKGVCSIGDLFCLYGPPGAGKSLIAPYIGYQISLGLPAFGKLTRRGVVFYVAAEDENGMEKRVSALYKIHGDAPDFVLVGGHVNLLQSKSQSLKQLLRQVRRQKPRLVILDTLAMAFPGTNRNEQDNMDLVVQIARMIIAAGTTVWIIHHPPKGDTSTPSGSIVLHGTLEAALLVTQTRDRECFGKMTKNKNGSLHEFEFTIETEKIGVDEDGDDEIAAYCKEGNNRDPDALPTDRPGQALAVLGPDPMTKAEWIDKVMASPNGPDKRNTGNQYVSRAIKDHCRFYSTDGERYWREKTWTANDFDELDRPSNQHMRRQNANRPHCEFL